MTTHLDEASWAALTADPAAHAALLEHLAQGCDACDAFLARRVDAFDGPVDALLLGLAPAPRPRDDVGWARLRRALGVPGRDGPRAAWPWVGGVAAVLAAAVGVGLWLARPAPHASSDGLKGPAAPALELEAAVREVDGRFVRLSDGARVSASAVLVLRAQASVDGVARVFLEAAGGAPRELGVARVRAGLHPLERADGLLGVSLADEAGPVTVWVVMGEAPMTTTQALGALQSRGAPALAVARVHVVVTP